MRIIVVTIFLVLFGMSISSKSVYFIYWKINQTSITQQFCENKAKPQLQCDGKCHLMKQWVKIETIEVSNSVEKQNVPPVKDKLSEIQLFFLPVLAQIKFSEKSLIQSTASFYYLKEMLHGYIFKISEPPECA